MMIAIFLSGFLRAAPTEFTNCVDLYCANAEKLNWHPCGDQKQMKSLQFHALKRGGETAQVCEVSQGSAAGSADSAVFSVPPYNLPSGTKILSVDPKTWVVRLETDFPSELYKETARDLSLPEGSKAVTFFYCKTTKIFSAFCASPEQVKGSETEENRPLRAFLNSAGKTFLFNSKGIFVFGSSGAKEASYGVDASYRSKYYGAFDGWNFFGITSSDGESLTTELVAYSDAAKTFTKVITFTEFDFSIEKAPDQGLLLRFKVPSEYDGAGTGRQLAKGFEVCPKGQFPAEVDKAFEMTLDARSAKELKLRNCEAAPGK